MPEKGYERLRQATKARKNERIAQGRLENDKEGLERVLKAMII